VTPDLVGAGWRGRLLVRAGGAVRNADNTTRNKGPGFIPFSCAAQLKAPHAHPGRRLKDDPMKTKQFTSVVPPSTEKTIRLPLPAIEVRERSPFTKYLPNEVIPLIQARLYVVGAGAGDRLA
jgi:hypothetical protein